MTTPSVSTLRRDMGDAMFSTLDVFRNANPTLLLRALRSRPSSVAPDFPLAFVDDRPETVTFDVQTMTRTMSPSVVVVFDGGDNAESALQRDVLVDALVMAFAATAGQFEQRSIHSTFTVADGEEAIGDYLFPSVRFTFPAISMQDGRP